MFFWGCISKFKEGELDSHSNKKEGFGPPCFLASLDLELAIVDGYLADSFTGAIRSLPPVSGAGFQTLALRR